MVFIFYFFIAVDFQVVPELSICNVFNLAGYIVGSFKFGYTRALLKPKQNESVEFGWQINVMKLVSLCFYN